MVVCAKYKTKGLVCGAEFPTKEELDQHDINQHQYVYCQFKYCKFMLRGRTTKTRQRMDRHERNHAEKRKHFPNGHKDIQSPLVTLKQLPKPLMAITVPPQISASTTSVSKNFTSVSPWTKSTLPITCPDKILDSDQETEIYEHDQMSLGELRGRITAIRAKSSTTYKRKLREISSSDSDTGSDSDTEKKGEQVESRNASPVRSPSSDTESCKLDNESSTPATEQPSGVLSVTESVQDHMPPSSPEVLRPESPNMDIIIQSKPLDLSMKRPTPKKKTKVSYKQPCQCGKSIQYITINIGK
ncbi:unnamed protein product [Owenia fusiformis]|uniref:Uncharacterized protein n=1 Tax=Owenia fusiformis TaxID=6347 RepID=A0A8J1TFP9_OWEFU|nr:unnamed protein product [Owenia fusiformis]